MADLPPEPNRSTIKSALRRSRKSGPQMTKPYCSRRGIAEKDDARRPQVVFACSSRAPIARAMFSKSCFKMPKRFGAIAIGRAMSASRRNIPDAYGFTAVAAKHPSDWHGELGDQLDSLPEEIDYVLRIDEDALFMSPVDGSAAECDRRSDGSGRICRTSGWFQLRRNIPGRVIEYFRRMLDNASAASDFVLRTVLFVSRVGHLETHLSSIAIASARLHLGI